ncbi:MAG: NUDIX domain-containing protein [Treponema sp.]|nr:NUDIX domain-containing protein [Treponema sp.]
MSINHFTATGIVFNSAKQVLMIFHNKLQVWLPPGGHIEENELPDDAVLREVYEETGVKAEILSNRQELVLSDNDCRGLKCPFTVLLENIDGDWSHNHIDMVYICTATSEELTIQKSEASDIGSPLVPCVTFPALGF